MMQYNVIEQKMRSLPDNCLEALDSFVDYLLFREKQSGRTRVLTPASKFFGSVKTLGDGLRAQRQMRDEWD